MRYPELPLYFDLSELRGYRYHTGVVFAAFVPGIGQSIAQGGRYDDIGADFGRARPATGWRTVMGGDVSDGKWHCYEVHIKVSSEGKPDGIGELWIDGEQRSCFHGASHPGKGWDSIQFGANNHEPENGRPMAVDFDDLAVSVEGRIGPLARKGGSEKGPP